MSSAARKKSCLKQNAFSRKPLTSSWCNWLVSECRERVCCVVPQCAMLSSAAHDDYRLSSRLHILGSLMLGACVILSLATSLVRMPVVSAYQLCTVSQYGFW